MIMKWTLVKPAQHKIMHFLAALQIFHWQIQTCAITCSVYLKRLPIQKNHLRGCYHCPITPPHTHTHTQANTESCTFQHTFSQHSKPTQAQKPCKRPSLSMQAQTREHKKHTGQLDKIPQRKCRSAL